MNQPASPYSKTSSNATYCGNIYHSTSTGNDPRKGWRTPLNNIIYSEQRDEETGYGYFGARYMDHELMTMWLSVDPLADKYPSLNPYNYCAWNPVRIVDPDGREIGDYYSKNGKWLGTDGKNDNVAYIASSVTYDAHGRVVTAKDKVKLSISNSELLDRATWVCGESGGSNERITSRVQNVGDATQILDAMVADYYAAAINNMSIDTKGGFYEAIKVRMSKKDEKGNIIYTANKYFDGIGNAGNSQSRAFAAARKKGGNALNGDARFFNSIASVIRSLTMPDPTGGCRAWLGGEVYAKPYMNKSNSKSKATVQFSFKSKSGYHSFYRY